jgi:2Fe-2S ferredoxin
MTIEVTFIQPDGTKSTAQAKHNQSLMQVALEHQINGIEGICGGCIACATCHVHVPTEWQSRVEGEDNEQSEEEIDMLDMALGRNETSRLGCQIKITKKLNGLSVRLPNV